MAAITIGAFANAAGVRTDTIRYYERNGLLPPPARTAAGYRLYDEADLERVKFVRKAQGLGFTLKEIGMLLALRDSDAARAADVLAITEQKIVESTDRIRELSRISTALRQLAERCPVDAPTNDCPILAHLANADAQVGNA
jgi:Hg(II)-responsive transcriptional regulator